MADGTHIQWTDATLNVVTGCTKISDGCVACYIERTPPLRMAGRRFDAPGIGGTTGVMLHPDRLTEPLRWRKPRRIFVCSLADLFHDDVPDGLIAALWLVMGQCAGLIPEQYRGHVFQILTKRPARMRAFLRKWSDVGDPVIPPMDPAASRCGRGELVAAAGEFIGGPMAYDWMDGPRYWPAALPGVWLGVSVEDQQWADTRIPVLLDIPAEVRWLSCEPLLGPVDLAGYLPRPADAPWYPVECRHGHDGCPICDRTLAPADALSWVIAGGESGDNARPMHPAWARSLRDQCTTSGVPFFFKQWGEWVPGRRNMQLTRNRWQYQSIRFQPDGTEYQPTDPEGYTAPGMESLLRVGKRAAGRLLDERTWDEYPAAVTA